jgi:alpha-tubulin suppressor-like RCC1 family protein
VLIVASGFVATAAGQVHTCGLTTAGAAYCWGANFSGQLGNGDPSGSASSTPVPVGGGLTFATLAVGSGDHSCGVTQSGAGYCWGRNGDGQLGDGSTTNGLTPVPVAGVLTFAVMTPGWRHTCGLTTGGAAYCWGQNNYGEIGDGSTSGRTTPVPVAGGLTFASVTAGAGHTCGLATGSVAYCWGLGGQLGDGTTTNRSVPVKVAGQP